MQPFGNSLVTKTMTGDMIRRLLQQQFVGLRRPDDAAHPADLVTSATSNRRRQPTCADRIGRIWVSGVEVTPTDSFRVTMNNFLAAGGDGFTVFNEGTERSAGPRTSTPLSRRSRRPSRPESRCRRWTASWPCRCPDGLMAWRPRGRQAAGRSSSANPMPSPSISAPKVAYTRSGHPGGLGYGITQGHLITGLRCAHDRSHHSVATLAPHQRWWSREAPIRSLVVPGRREAQAAGDARDGIGICSRRSSAAGVASALGGRLTPDLAQRGDGVVHPHRAPGLGSEACSAIHTASSRPAGARSVKLDHHSSSGVRRSGGQEHGEVGDVVDDVVAHHHIGDAGVRGATSGHRPSRVECTDAPAVLTRTANATRASPE